MQEYAEVIGLIAGVCTTICTVPQIVKIWRLRSAKSISIYMPILSGTGNFLWLIYGIMLSSLSLIITNIISCFLALFMIISKIKFDKTEV